MALKDSVTPGQGVEQTAGEADFLCKPDTKLIADRVSGTGAVGAGAGDEGWDWSSGDSMRMVTGCSLLWFPLQTVTPLLLESIFNVAP